MPPPQPQQPPSHPAHTGPPPRHPSTASAPAASPVEARREDIASPRDSATSREPAEPIRARARAAKPRNARATAPPPRPDHGQAARHHGRCSPASPAAGPPRPPHLDAPGELLLAGGRGRGREAPRRHLPRGAHGFAGPPPAAAKQGRGSGWG
nr:uncharacterized protein LOC127310814 [Lolium perenne]